MTVRDFAPRTHDTPEPWAVAKARDFLAFQADHPDARLEDLVELLALLFMHAAREGGVRAMDRAIEQLEHRLTR